MHIPADICWMIIDVLAEQLSSPPQRYRALLSCVLISHNWLERAQVHLYSIVSLDTLRHHLLFARTITGLPNLGAHVREIRSALLMNPRSGWRDGSMSLGGPTQLPMPLNMPQTFVNLHSLSFISDQWTIPNLLLGFMQSFAVCNTLRSLTLRNIRTMSFALLRDLIQAHRDLEYLQVWGCMWLPDRTYPVGSIQALEALKTVNVSQDRRYHMYLQGSHQKCAFDRSTKRLVSLAA